MDDDFPYYGSKQTPPKSQEGLLVHLMILALLLVGNMKLRSIQYDEEAHLEEERSCSCNTTQEDTRRRRTQIDECSIKNTKSTKKPIKRSNMMLVCWCHCCCGMILLFVVLVPMSTVIRAVL